MDWKETAGPRRKLDEELGELDEAIARLDHGADEETAALAQEVESELGDVLFTVVNIARKRGIDPEAALRGTVDRFSRRVEHVEALCAERSQVAAELDERALDALWEESKSASRRTLTAPTQLWGRRSSSRPP